jgi:hypothetical protein
MKVSDRSGQSRQWQGRVLSGQEVSHSLASGKTRLLHLKQGILQPGDGPAHTLF